MISKGLFIIRFFIWCCFKNNPCHCSIVAMYSFSLWFFFCIFFQNLTCFHVYITTSTFGCSVSLVSALWHFHVSLHSAPALFEMKGKDIAEVTPSSLLRRKHWQFNALDDSLSPSPSPQSRVIIFQVWWCHCLLLPWRKPSGHRWTWQFERGKGFSFWAFWFLFLFLYFWPGAWLCTSLRNWNIIMCNLLIKSLCNVRLF